MISCLTTGQSVESGWRSHLCLLEFEMRLYTRSLNGVTKQCKFFLHGGYQYVETGNFGNQMIFSSEKMRVVVAQLHIATSLLAKIADQLLLLLELPLV